MSPLVKIVEPLPHNIWRLMGRNRNLLKGFPELWLSKVGAYLNSQSHSSLPSYSVTKVSLFFIFFSCLSLPLSLQHRCNLATVKTRKEASSSREGACWVLNVNRPGLSSHHYPPLNGITAHHIYSQSLRALPWKNKHAYYSTIQGQPNLKIKRLNRHFSKEMVSST